MKSARDLYVYTLENVLEVAGINQPVQDDDVNALKRALPSLLALLRRMDFADIRINPDDDSYESIPDAALSPLAALLANEVAGSYGKAKADYTALLSNLARATSNGPRYYPQQVEYF